MKKLFATLLVALLLLVGAVLALPLLLSSDAAREQFSKRVSAISGTNIVLGGPVSLSVFPDLGLVAKDVSLAAADGTFAVSVVKVVANVKLTSILSGNLEITGFSLDRPEIVLSQAENQSKQTGTVDADTGQNAKDPFASAVELLERLSLNRFEISRGKVISRTKNGAESSVDDIDLVLRAPNLDGPINLKFSANLDGQQISSTVSLASLRPILKRQASKIDVTLKMQPAPHPALADLTASGNILLAADGSYQISDGLLTSLGQPLRLDVLYRPGIRPYVNLSIDAKDVDLGIIEKVTGTKPVSGETKNPASNSAGPDFGPLLAIDADVRIKIDRFSMDGAEIRKIDLQAKLDKGNLTVSLGDASVANGTVAAQFSANLADENSGGQGSLLASSLGITNLAKLANMDIPVTGNLGLNIGYAFSGFDPASIKASFNFAGAVTLTNGVVRLPASAMSGLGPSAKTISGLNVEANIAHVQKPIDIKARMTWNGESIQLNSLVTPYSFITNGGGPLTISLDSRRVSADYSGNVNLSGKIDGGVKISTKSLDRLLAWLGQGNDAGLGKFSYSGRIKLDAIRFAFDQAKISLNGVNARGSGSFGLKGKPSITTTLAFDVLDIAALTGGNSAGGAASGGANSGDTAIDLSVLKGFDAIVRLSARKIGYGKVTAGPVKTTLTVKNGIARIKLPQTPFYGGSVFADIVADGSTALAAIAIDAKLSNIDALPLFRDAAEFDRIEGKLNASIKVKGSGKSTRQLSRSLSGTSAANFADGAIRGINIAKIYNNIAAVLASGFKENSGDKTTFTALGLSFVIDKGVATTNDLKLIGPLVRMDGAGKVDLGEERIDMRLNPRVVASASGQGGKYDVGGVGIPVIIKGPLAKPRVYPDLRELLKNPQLALKSLSKLGLKIKGIDLKGLGKGKIDIKKIAAGKLNLEKLDKLGGKGTGEKVGKVIGDLITGKKSGEDGQNSSNTGQVVGTLLNQLIKPQGSDNTAADSAPPVQNSGQAESVGKTLGVSGRIPVPTPNPRRQAGIQPAPKTTKQRVVDQIVPKLKLPVDDETTKKGLNSLIDKILQ